MTPILTASEALAIFAFAALAIDRGLRLLDRWRRRGVIATGADVVNVRGKT